MRKPELENAPQAADQQEDQESEWTIEVSGDEAKFFNWLRRDATTEQRLKVCRKFYNEGIGLRLSDPESGVLILGDRPLSRAFVLPKDRTLDVETQPEKVLASIEECIHRHNGVVRKCDRDGDSDANQNNIWDFDFPEGFGSDGCVVGLFFSSESRDCATHEILSQWGKSGVRTETTAAEFSELRERRNHCRENFNEDEFRSDFEIMTHDERLGEIEELWKCGVEFEFSDPNSEMHYSSMGASSTFCVDYSFGVTPKEFQPEWRSSCPDAMSMDELLRIEEDTEERMRTIVQIERAIQEVVIESGGEVDGIGRMVDKDENGELSSDTSGCTMIVCRFPSEESRDQIVKEVLDGWGMFDVTVDKESRRLTLEDKIEEAALMAARIESDPEREQQLLAKKGPAFDELKDPIINEVIADWESNRKGHAS